jgi:hypothetical protein
MILAILKTLLSFAGGLIADALELLVVIWSKAGRAIATVLAIGLGCLVLVQCGEIKTLRTDNLDLQGQRNDLTDRLAICRGNVTGLQTALDDQSARVRAIGEESARRIDQSRKALSEAQESRQEAEARARRLLTAPAGIDGCARAYSAMDAVKEDLR